MSAPFHVDASVRGRLAYRAKRGLGAGNLEASEETGTTIPVELATFGAVPQRRRGAPGAAPLGEEDRRFRKRSADGWPRVEQENSAFGNASSSDWTTVGVVEIAGTTMRRAPRETKTVRVAAYDVLGQEVRGSSTGRFLPGNPGHYAPGR